jgi:hypothetical protein
MVGESYTEERHLHDNSKDARQMAVVPANDSCHDGSAGLEPLPELDHCGVDAQQFEERVEDALQDLQ